MLCSSPDGSALAPECGYFWLMVTSAKSHSKAPVLLSLEGSGVCWGWRLQITILDPWTESQGDQPRSIPLCPGC